MKKKDLTNKDLQFLRLLVEDRHLLENMILIMTGVKELSYPDYLWALLEVLGEDTDPDGLMSPEEFQYRKEEVLAEVKDYGLGEIQKDLVLLDEVIDKIRQRSQDPPDDGDNS